MTPGHAEDLSLLRDAAAEAATLALTYFRNDPRAWTKGEGSPVSEADVAIDRLLSTILLEARPDYGWLSEEIADGPDRLGRERVFVVDPIDGTREFLKGGREWTISLAVVERGRPVAAVLAGPALSMTYWAANGAGAFRDGLELRMSAPPPTQAARFASSRRYARAFATETGIATDPRYVASLAYRIALVASGEIDAAIAKPNARDWDLAAADLLVQEAGARLTDLAGRTLRYNGRETVHPALIATRPELFGPVSGAVLRAERPMEQGRRDGGDGSVQFEAATAPASGVWRRA